MEVYTQSLGQQKSRECSNTEMRWTLFKFWGQTGIWSTSLKAVPDCLNQINNYNSLNFHFFSCPVVDCGRLEDTEVVRYTIAGETVFKQIATARCQDGYNAKGDAFNITCQSNGQWSEASCQGNISCCWLLIRALALQLALYLKKSYIHLPSNSLLCCTLLRHGLDLLSLIFFSLQL